MKTAAWIIAGVLSAVASGAAAQAEMNALGSTRVKVVSYRDIPFRSVVRQQYDFSCGSAALATLLRHHYGRDVTERDVFEAMFALGDQTRIREMGFSLLDMKQYLLAHGYASDGYRTTLDDLAARGAPAIVMIDTQGYKHFVVLKGIDGDRVLVGDPALGLKTYDRAAFGAIWNNIAFLVGEPTDRFNNPVDWSPWTGAPLDVALPESSLASLTQQLPPLYQITTQFSLDGYLR